MQSLAKHTAIGNKATPCRKCSSEFHFVNKLGGIQCERCSPPKTESDVKLRLRIDGGFWADAATERFDCPAGPAEQSQQDKLPNYNQNRNLITKSIQEHGATPAEPKQPSVCNGAAKSVAQVHPSLRGIGGELSEREIDLYLSETIWGQPDQWIVFKPKARLVNRLGGRGQKKQSDRSKLEIRKSGGEVFSLPVRDRGTDGSRK